MLLLDSIEGIPFEQVASARPDVILAGTHYGIDDDHATLVGIAPVVTTAKGLTEDTWQDQTLLIGEALGVEQPAAARAVADLLLMTYGGPDLQAEIEANPLFAALPVVREGRVVTLDIALSTALTVPSVLRVGYVLDQLVPQIETRLA